MFLKKMNNRGLTLIEMAISLGIIGIVTAGIWNLISDAQNRMQDQAAALAQKNIAKAVQDYVSSSISDLKDYAETVACSGVSGVNGSSFQLYSVSNTDTGAITTDSIQFLQDRGFLGDTASGVNPFNEEYKVSVRVPNCAAETLAFEVMVYTDGTSNLPPKRLRSIAGMIGANGGYIDGINPTTLQQSSTNLTVSGAYRNWTADAADYTDPSGNGPDLDSVAVMNYYNGSAMTTSFLNRYSIPNYVQANRMFTAITWSQPDATVNTACDADAAKDGYSLCNVGNVFFASDSDTNGNDLILNQNDIFDVRNFEAKGYLRVYAKNHVTRSASDYPAPYSDSTPSVSQARTDSGTAAGSIIAQNDIMSDEGEIFTSADGGHVHTFGDGANIYTEGAGSTIYTTGSTSDIYSVAARVFTGDATATHSWCDGTDICSASEVMAESNIRTISGNITAWRSIGGSESQTPGTGNIRAVSGRIYTGNGDAISTVTSGFNGSCDDLDICAAGDLQTAADLIVAGGLYLGGDLTVHGDTLLKSTLTVEGESTFEDDVTVDTQLTVPNLLVNNITPESGDTITIGANVNATGYRVQADSFQGQSFLYSSDENLKQNIAQLHNQLDQLLQIKGVSFDWKGSNEHDLGVIAQDVEKVYPDLVADQPEGFKAVQYANLIGPIIEAIRELKEQNDDLKQQVEHLKSVQ